MLTYPIKCQNLETENGTNETSTAELINRSVTESAPRKTS